MKLQAKKIREKLAQSYSRDNWKEVLLGVFDGRIQLKEKPTVLHLTHNKVEEFYLLGNIQLDDGRVIALYELNVTDDTNIARNRVTLNKFISSTIDDIDVHGVIAVFQKDINNYRLTFSSYGTDYDEKADDFIEKSTDSKRYTYLLGENESCRTAAEQLYGISKKEELLLDDIEHAFNVDIVSKRFFDDYIKEFDRLVTYIKGKPTYFQAIFEKDETAARNFVKRFMGRLVFLKFVQKKGWLGVPLEEKGWEHGDYGFLESRFRESGNKTYFLTSFLNPLFEALNTPDRENHAFEDYDFKVPYLSGGLFENENKEELRIDFDEELLEYLFDFFDRYNFTIDENDAMDREVGIDPEMLGHIFENLLEDNKDKGAFYTPKEIVRYMCQESLKEYLKTYLEKKQVWPQDTAQQEALENTIAAFVEKKETAVIARKYDKHISQALKEVKICDPAIGSGAFPMGLLNEIFNLTKALHTESADAVGAVWNMVGKKWEPHKVKQNIIQHSIYGVDIEAGAVEIARLRFWLSLIIEEKEPKPLPHLEYKIVEGNSLISKLGDTIIDIEWEAAPEESQTNMFGAHEKVIQRQELLTQITALQKQIFAPDCDHDRLSLELRNRKIELLQLQLAIMVDKDGMVDKPQRGTRNFKKQTENWLKTKGWKQQIQQLEAMKKSHKTPLEFFDWKLDFPEVMNPEINEDAGFDIVIGNPPYIQIKQIPDLLKGFYKSNFDYAVGRFNIFYFFIEITKYLSKNKGITSFIVPDRLLLNTQCKNMRLDLLKNQNIIEIIAFSESVFETAVVDSIILTYSNEVNKDDFLKAHSEIDLKNLKTIERINVPYSHILQSPNNQLDINFDPFISKIITKINFECDTYGSICEIKDGIIQSKIPDLLFLKEKLNQNCEKLLFGKDIQKFKIEWDENWVHYDIDKMKQAEAARGGNGLRMRNKEVFNEAKILTRQTADSIIAAIDLEGKYYYSNTLHGARFSDITLNPLFILGILNSKLITFYYNKITAEKGKVFAQIKIELLKLIPIKKTVNQQSISEVVKRLLENPENDNLKEILNNLVFRLYQLTYEEALIIEPELSDRLTKDEYAAIEVE